MTKEENEKRLEHLRGIVRRLPDKPGSYQFYDEEHNIIYVGKAKSLKARVSSYFHTEVDRFKTKVLVSKIFDISYTVVNTARHTLASVSPMNTSHASSKPVLSTKSGEPTMGLIAM